MSNAEINERYFEEELALIQAKLDLAVEGLEKSREALLGEIHRDTGPLGAEETLKENWPWLDEVLAKVKNGLACDFCGGEFPHKLHVKDCVVSWRQTKQTVKK